MLLILIELSSVHRVVGGGQSTLSISQIVFPLTFVPVLLPSEYLTKSMPLIGLPLSYEQVFVIIIAVALTFPEVLPPLSMILIVGPFLLVRAMEYAISVPDVAPIHEYLTFIMIPIAISVL